MGVRIATGNEVIVKKQFINPADGQPIQDPRTQEAQYNKRASGPVEEGEGRKDSTTEKAGA